MTDQSEDRKTVRRAAMIPRAVGFMTLLALGMPVAVLIAYYAFGWQAAVLLFPVLMLSLGTATNNHRRSYWNLHWPLKRILTHMVLFGIPIAAVVTGKAEIMRIWAYAVAVPFTFAITRKKVVDWSEKPRPIESGTMWKAVILLGTAGTLFVLGSELLWVWSSISVWIWYHAFAAPIFFGLFLMLMIPFSNTFVTDTSDIVDSEPPPRAPDDRSDSAGTVVRRQPAGLPLRYGDVSLSQFKAILAETDWSGEDVPTTKYAQVEGSQPETSIVAKFLEGQVNVTRDGDQTATVYWRYFEPSPLKVQGLLRHHYVRKVPLGLVADVGDAIWADRWEEVGVLLADYAEPVEPKR